jgi:hypothetical protein
MEKAPVRWKYAWLSWQTSNSPINRSRRQRRRPVLRVTRLIEAEAIYAN